MLSECDVSATHVTPFGLQKQWEIRLLYLLYLFFRKARWSCETCTRRVKRSNLVSLRARARAAHEENPSEGGRIVSENVKETTK